MFSLASMLSNSNGDLADKFANGRLTPYLCPLCGDRLLLPVDDPDELACGGCGACFKLPEPRVYTKSPENSQLVSRGMKDGGIGTDQEQVIAENKRRRVKKQEDPRESRADGLMLSLRALWGNGHDSAFWIKRTQELKDLGWSDEKVAYASAWFRRYFASKDKERAKEMQEVWDKVVGKK